MFKAIARAFQKLGAEIQREAEAWKIRCTSCGRQKSLRSAGGIRYGASGASYTLGFCSGCHSLRMLKIYRPSDEPPAIPPRGPNLSG